VVINYLDVNSPDVQELRKHQLDTVLCLNVLEHIERDDDVLTHLHEILENHGQIILLVPAHPSLFCSIDRNLGHIRRYNREELEAKIRRAGFEIVAMEYFNWIGAIGWWFCGKMLRQHKISSTSKRGFQLVQLLRRFDRVFKKRFGLSLIVIAQKQV
jgi:SAM-dependent methyltransferase